MELQEPSYISLTTCELLTLLHVNTEPLTCIIVHRLPDSLEVGEVGLDFS